MAKKSADGVRYPNPYNEMGGGEDGDVSGDRVYYTYAEAMAMQLKSESCGSTPNTDSGKDIMAGSNPGEPDPFRK